MKSKPLAPKASNSTSKVNLRKSDSQDGDSDDSESPDSDIETEQPKKVLKKTRV